MYFRDIFQLFIEELFETHKEDIERMNSSSDLIHTSRPDSKNINIIRTSFGNKNGPKKYKRMTIKMSGIKLKLHLVPLTRTKPILLHGPKVSPIQNKKLMIWMIKQMIDGSALCLIRLKDLKSRGTHWLRWFHCYLLH